MNISSLFQRRILFITGCFGLILLVWVVVGNNIFSQREAGSTESDSLAAHTDESGGVERVFIKDFYKYQHPSDLTHGSVENTLYDFIGRKPGLYTGTIREGSTKNTSDTLEFLVDIEPAQVTYKIIFLREAHSNKLTPLSVRCAPKNQQLLPTNDCLDGSGA